MQNKVNIHIYFSLSLSKKKKTVETSNGIAWNEFHVKFTHRILQKSFKAFEKRLQNQSVALQTAQIAMKLLRF